MSEINSIESLMKESEKERKKKKKITLKLSDESLIYILFNDYKEKYQ